jgi:S-adenosylmethionine hydrolase
VGQGELLALIGSEGLLEVAVRDGSAAALIGAGPGVRVKIETDRPSAT